MSKYILFAEILILQITTVLVCDSLSILSTTNPYGTLNPDAGISLLSFLSTVWGLLTFSLVGIPIWVSIIYYILTFMLLYMFADFVRGV